MCMDCIDDFLNVSKSYNDKKQTSIICLNINSSTRALLARITVEHSAPRADNLVLCNIGWCRLAVFSFRLRLAQLALSLQ